jgi:hypothetical protein
VIGIRQKRTAFYLLGRLVEQQEKGEIAKLD